MTQWLFKGEVYDSLEAISRAIDADSKDRFYQEQIERLTDYGISPELAKSFADFFYQRGFTGGVQFGLKPEIYHGKTEAESNREPV